MSSLGAAQDLQNPQVLVEWGRGIFKVLIMRSFLCKTLVSTTIPNYKGVQVLTFLGETEEPRGLWYL